MFSTNRRREGIGALVRSTLAIIASSVALAGAALAQTSGAPIKVGGSLALTGPLAQTSMIHKIAAEVYIDQANKRGGWLGRPIEYVVYDDQSKPDQTRTLYDKLVTVDKVDLLIGPYATNAILAAMPVAERYSKMIFHMSFGIPRLAKYERQIPVGPMGYTPEESFPGLVLDALASVGKAPKTIAIATSKFSSVHFVAVGAREVAKKRGIKEALFVEYEFGAKDYGPIAARIRDADPDLLFVGAIGLEGNMILEALKKLNYTPRNHFYLYPAPGPLVASPEGKNALSVGAFEDHPPFTNDPIAAAYAKEYRERATKAGLPYPIPEMQGATQYAGWQVVEAAVKATKSLDDKVLSDWIRKNPVDTIIGKLQHDGPNNYGKFIYKLKQVQDGKWLVVWPPEFAAPGAKLVAN